MAVGGLLWLQGQPPTCGWTAGGRETASLQRHSTANGAHPALGPYNETRFYWRASDGTLFQTAFQLFADGETALFEQVRCRTRCSILS